MPTHAVDFIKPSPISSLSGTTLPKKTRLVPAIASNYSTPASPLARHSSKFSMQLVPIFSGKLKGLVLPSPFTVTEQPGKNPAVLIAPHEPT